MSMANIQSVIRAIIECSYYVSPRRPGLTHSELVEAASRFDLYPGEIGDALTNLRLSVDAERRYQLDHHNLTHWRFFEPNDPEYRNFDAFDFIYKVLIQLNREVGAAKAQIERSVLLSRGIANGLSEHDMDVAIMYLSKSEAISEKDGSVRFTYQINSQQQLPSEARRQHGNSSRTSSVRAKAYQVVKDIIERRTDGRPLAIEPLGAFGQKLAQLGYAPFRLWWTQTSSEMRNVDAVQAPTSVTVLAAALIEGALTFVVSYARGLDAPVFKSNDFNGAPRSWKLDDLVNSASMGGGDAILDPPTKALAQTVVRNRQRIHAGRMLTDYPQGVPDIRIDEVQQAKATAEQVVRRVLDWLEKHPAS